MSRLFTVFASTFAAFIMVACMETVAEDAPKLSVRHSLEPPVSYPVFLGFSEDGKTLLVGGKYGSMDLYRTSDYTILDRVVADRPGWDDITDQILAQSALESFLSAGFIDANTWYYGKNRSSGPGTMISSAHIRSISPAREIFQHDFKYGGASWVSANERYITKDEELFDWKTKKNYFPIHIVREYAAVASSLTRSGRVMSYAFDFVQIDDPEHEKTDGWDAGGVIADIAMTPDERHVVTVSRSGSCRLWRLPEKAAIERCGRWHLFDLEAWPRLSLSPDGKRFAVSTDNQWRVYRIEPFALEMEGRMSFPIHVLALADDGRLAASDGAHVQVWNLAARHLTGAFDLTDEKHVLCTPETCRYIDLALQPKGKQLAATWTDSSRQNVVILELPEPAR
jgi:WD40 repeat protein